MGWKWLPKFIAGVLVTLLVAEGVARVVIGEASAPVLRWHDFSSQLKVEQMDELGQAGVVIVGTSMAQQDLVPTLFSQSLDDVSVYNAGLNGGVPTVTESWLLDHVVPRLEPSLVVWGLSALDMSAAYGDATKNAYDQALESKPGLLAPADRWGSSFSTLVSSRGVLREPTKLRGEEASLRREQFTRATEELGPDGERINFESALGPDRQDEMLSRLNPYRLDRDDLAAIVRTVSNLRSQGIEVIFVELPVPSRFVSLMPRATEDLQLFSDALQQLADELGVVVLVPEIKLMDSDFVDFSHLSSAAATALSTDISGQLSRAR